MKAEELAKKLMEHPDYDVMVSQDEEGNGFNTLAVVELGKYDGDDVYGIDDTYAPKHSKPVFVLWP